MYKLTFLFVSCLIAAGSADALEICEQYRTDPVNIQRLTDSLEHEMPAPFYDDGNRLQIGADNDEATIAPRVTLRDQVVTVVVPTGFFYDACDLLPIESANLG